MPIMVVMGVVIMPFMFIMRAVIMPTMIVPIVVVFVVVIVLALRSAGRTRTLHIRPSVC